jgi:hypothetical protein
MSGTLGLITIGQSPREDYESIFHQYAGGAEILWAGALDGIARDDALALHQPDGAYPLHTGLADGTPQRPGQVADRLGLTINEVKKIEARAFSRIREVGPVKGLERFLDSADSAS